MRYERALTLFRQVTDLVVDDTPVLHNIGAVELSMGDFEAAPAVFVGYGISAPDLGYDDYAGIDVKGKVLLALRHAPDYGGRNPN